MRTLSGRGECACIARCFAFEIPMVKSAIFLVYSFPDLCFYGLESMNTVRRSVLILSHLFSFPC